ncbi:MAG: DUF371 domain-containing protein [Promethearchaeota archaeon]
MTIIEEIFAQGHKNILCTHGSTIEITKDLSLTKAGNCILGVNSSKACFDLRQELKESIKSGKKIKVSLKVDNLEDYFYGFGNKDLSLSDKNDIVFRKSEYLCNRTALIRCSKSSKDLNNELIDVLKDPNKKLRVTFEIDDSNGA